MAAAGLRFRWKIVADSFRQPYRVTIPMVILVMLVPGYLIIARFARAGTTYVPEFAFDRALPLVPAWSLVYGALYLFLIILPVLVVREEEHIRRTVRAYLLCWVTAYAVFAFYPTAASRPAHVTGDGFGIWGLLALNPDVTRGAQAGIPLTAGYGAGLAALGLGVVLTVLGVASGAALLVAGAVL